MRRRAIAQYQAGPFVIVRYNDRPGWTVTKPDALGRLRNYWPVPLATLPAAFRAVEEHLGTTLPWGCPLSHPLVIGLGGSEASGAEHLPETPATTVEAPLSQRPRLALLVIR